MNDNKDQPNFLSYNVSGFGSRETKRRKIITLIEQDNPWVFSLVDARPKIGREKQMYRFSGYTHIHAPYENPLNGVASRGISFFVSKRHDISTNGYHKENDGNLLIMDLQVQGIKMAVAAVYGPNEPAPQFYHNMKAKIEVTGRELWIALGDFNTVLNPNLDAYNYSDPKKTHKENRAVINNWIDSGWAHDAFRELNGNQKTYTWERKDEEKPKSERQKSRLDLCLVSSMMLQFVTHCGMKKKLHVKNDHKGVEICIDFHGFRRGPGDWRSPPGLEDDPAYQVTVEQTIRNTIFDHLDPEAPDYAEIIDCFDAIPTHFLYE